MKNELLHTPSTEKKVPILLINSYIYNTLLIPFDTFILVHDRSYSTTSMQINIVWELNFE